MPQENDRLEKLKDEVWDWINSINIGRDISVYLSGLLVFTLKCKGYLEDINIADPYDFFEKVEERINKKSALAQLKILDNANDDKNIAFDYDYDDETITLSEYGTELLSALLILKLSKILTHLKFDDDDDETFANYSSIIKYLDEESFYLRIYKGKTIRQWDINELALHEAEIFESILERIIQSEPKLWGHYTLPTELTKLMTEIYNPSNIDEVYDAFSGLGDIALALDRSQYFSVSGHEESLLVYGLNQLRLLAHNRINGYELGSCFDFLNEDESKVDIIFAKPPINFVLTTITDEEEKMINGEPYFIEQAVSSLSDEGKAAILLPLDFINKKGDYLEVRRWLIENDLVEFIVTFPSNILIHSSIPICLLGINKNKEFKKQVQFLDATYYVHRTKSHLGLVDYKSIVKILNQSRKSESSILVSNKDILKTNCDFRPLNYLQRELDGEQLSNILEPIALKSLESRSELKRVRHNDLKSDPLHFELDFFRLESGEYDENYVVLSESALLFSGFGNSLKPTFIKLYSGQEICIQKGIFCYKIDESKVNKSYLVNELYNKSVQQQFDTYSSGSTIKRISNKDILQIKITIIPLTEQVALVKGLESAENLNRTRDFYLQQTVEYLENSIKEENSFLRHAIAGSLKNMRSSVRALKSIIEQYVTEKNNELINRKVSPEATLTLGKYLEILERDINTVTEKTRLNAIQKESIGEAEMDSIEIISFFKEYILELKSQQNLYYDIKINNELSSFFEENNNQKIYIEGNRKLLKELFDNLVENAEKHAFFNGNNNFMEFELGPGGDMTYIVFSNSGHPFPEGFTFDMFIRKGSKTNSSEGDGFGGWYINEIIKKHKGNILFDRMEGGSTDITTLFEIQIPITFMLNE